VVDIAMQTAVDHTTRLHAIQPYGLLPGTYTSYDLLCFKGQIIYVQKAMKFCAADLCNYLLDSNLTEEDKQYHIQTLADGVDIKVQTLRKYASTMRKWHIDDRAQDPECKLTLAHYTKVSRFIADYGIEAVKDVLETAAVEEWNDEQTLGQALSLFMPDSQHNRLEKEEDTATEIEDALNGFAREHDIEAIRRVSPTKLVVSSVSGVLVIESDAPIRWTILEEHTP
jgi:hypothetical protein